MEKRLLVIALAISSLSIFNACEKSKELISPTVYTVQQEAVKPDVYSENGYLVVNDFGTADSLRTILQNKSVEKQ